ncbi:MAG: adenylate/guanylate cyclase domain-containing protein [Pseudomonadota bacterium]
MDHIDWILGRGRALGLQGLADGLGPRLVTAGVPLMRLRFGMRTTHPLTAALSYLWEADGTAEVMPAAPRGLEQRAAYIGSPMAYIADTQRPFRRDLRAPLGNYDHVVLHELQRRGATDYYGLPLRFVAGQGGTVIWVCGGAAGFSEDDIALLTRLSEVLAPIVEAHANRHLAEAIAHSYLGPRTGQLVLDGRIARGDIEEIEAAILFSDIRGWTAVNATRTPAEALDIANSYFEVLSDAVAGAGGEVLKFTGDGVLALFPSAGDQHAACSAALRAAQGALARARDTALPVPFGTGIHYGRVLYGNVGARDRIDFTVLGQAVNIASRIEAFCGRMEEAILLSEDAATSAGQPVRQVGTEVLKGLNSPVPLFAPA